MREVTLKVFKFEELTSDVQKRVIERYRNKEDFCWDYTDSDMLTEWFEELLANTMFCDCKVTWSLSHCQGDGVAIYGEVDREKLVQACKESNKFTHHEMRRIKHISENVTFELRQGYSYYSNVYDSYHYFSQHEGHSYDKYLADLVERLLKFIKEVSIELESGMERDGYSQIDEAYSDECIKDRLINNDYEFTEGGEEF